MIRALTRFAAELRRAGLTVSPAEWLDALRAVRAVGLEDRAAFRVALRSTLAKQRALWPRFDEAFDRFFASGLSPRSHRERASLGSGGRGSGSVTSRGSREGQGNRPAGSRSIEGRPLRERLAPPTLLLRTLGRRGGPAGLRSGTGATRMSDRERGARLRRVVLAPEGLSSRSAGVPGSAPALDRRPLRDRWTRAEEAELAIEMQRIIQRLRLGVGRRRRRAHRGGYDLRRLFRENLGFDGVPWLLPRRRARLRRASIVLLVDVSWSTSRASGLFLSLAAQLLQPPSRVRALFFVDAVVDASESVRRWCAERGARSFARLLAELRSLNLDAPSDYGRAFHALLRSPLRPGGRRTALVVLGDGRINRFDPQAWAFEEIAARCGAVLWLVPEPAVRWGTGDSALAAYLPHVDTAIEVRDLRGLEAGVRALARRIRA